MLWLVRIWQVSSCGKYMQHLETCLLIAEADRVLCHLVMFLTVFSYRMYKMKYSCYQDSSVIHGLFLALLVEKCTACQNHWKSNFGWHHFQNWAYSLALAWGVRGLKSLKRFWNTWWPSEAASRLVSLSNYCLWCVFFFGFLKSSVWFMRLKFIHEQWSNLQ